MRKNLSLHYETLGQYATDIFTDVAVQTIQNHNKDIPLFMYLSHMAPHTANANELQAPDETLKQFSYIQDKRRRTYAAMVSKLDESVGRVVRALKESSMLENSIILFFSDNGAPIIGEHYNAGSNFPFKGVIFLSIKNTYLIIYENLKVINAHIFFFSKKTRLGKVPYIQQEQFGAHT